MQRGRILYTEKINDHQTNGINVDLSIYGIFDTIKVEWVYYIISHKKQNGVEKLTSDICKMSINNELNTSNVSTYGRKVSTQEEGIKHLRDYKIKWETGSNNTTQEERDKKIDDILR